MRANNGMSKTTNSMPFQSVFYPFTNTARATFSYLPFQPPGPKEDYARISCMPFQNAPQSQQGSSSKYRWLSPNNYSPKTILARAQTGLWQESPGRSRAPQVMKDYVATGDQISGFSFIGISGAFEIMTPLLHRCYDCQKPPIIHVVILLGGRALLEIDQSCPVRGHHMPFIIHTS